MKEDDHDDDDDDNEREGVMKFVLCLSSSISHYNLIKNIRRRVFERLKTRTSGISLQ